MRHTVTVKRNDGRYDSGFKRWTVYVGNVAAFDVEAQQTTKGALVHVIDANNKTLACFDGRSGSYYEMPEKRKA